MEIMFDKLNLLNFIEKETEYKQPVAVENEADKKVIEEANEKLRIRNKKCKGLIVQKLANCQLGYTKGKISPFSVWKSLQNTYERTGMATQLQVRRQLLSTKHNPRAETLEAHFLRMENLIRQLKATVSESDEICHLLFSMPQEYNVVVTAIEMMSFNNLTLGFVKNRLLDEVSKRLFHGQLKQVKSEVHPSTAFASYNKRGKARSRKASNTEKTNTRPEQRGQLASF